MSDTPANQTHLLGQQVEVVLSREDGKESVIARGRLLAFDDGGEVRLLDDMGFVHYCWPMLEIRKVDDD